MNIFKRKKPIVVDIPPRPPRPEYYRPSFLYVDALFVAKEPELNNGKVFYPIGAPEGRIEDYFTTKKKAQAACDKLNIPIKKGNKKIIAKVNKLAAIRRKEIAEWDKKYGEAKC